jgi:nucleotide-binding universal stress UspA family protein
MKVVLCLDYTTAISKILASAKSFLDELKNAEVTVVHIIDEMLFSSATGHEVQLNETLVTESSNLKAMCKNYFGEKVNYIEEYGIPKLKADEILADMEYDLLVIGSSSSHNLAERLIGGFGDHLLGRSVKPVLIMPIK